MSTVKSGNSTKYKADFTSVLKDKSFHLISDPEGYAIEHLCGKKPDDSCATETNPLIVLGDLIDSTIALTADGNLLKMGDVKNLKSFNLHNLKLLKNNPNIRVLFGNRDLNKIKLLPLLKFREVKGKVTAQNYIPGDLNQYEKPEQSSDPSKYLELAKLLKKNINDEIWKWDIPDLKHWFPFWRPKANIPDHWKAGKYDAKENMTCLDRFFIIFGSDPEDGTMGAAHLLYCIPREILGDSFNEKFPEFSKTDAINLRYYTYKDKAFRTTLEEPLKGELELAAALVFTVFSRLFIPPNGDYLNGRQLPYDGLLYDLYTSDRSYFCAYANLNKRLLLFSHGGITKDFLSTKVKLTQFDPYFKGNMNELINLQGGYYKEIDSPNKYNKSSIMGKIDFYNDEYKQLLKDVIEHYLKNNKSTWNTPNISRTPTPGMAKLLVTSAGVNILDKFNSGTFSPVLPGINAMRIDTNIVFCMDCELVQFIGHLPQGFGATIDLFKPKGNDTKLTYHVNLDISNTSFTHGDVTDFEKVVDNYFYMTYNGSNGSLNIHGVQHLKGDKFKNIEGYEGGSEGAEGKIRIEYDDTYDILSDTFKNVLIKTSPDGAKTYIHGKFKSNTLFMSTDEKYNYTPNQISLEGQSAGARRRRVKSRRHRRHAKKNNTKKRR